ncbi:hypothetical protein JYK14_26110 [Siccirubricoccus sp. KC 17139]|uniref:Uncharacterized protein n=1 Tax=Siccirubricoccus soli TaxID=2899147 RepID=A0ABT1DCI3_9PROT|nr:hypothetical protein [Siccirubricoccus soli]MCO6419614.1 hypothetical protein [Siccirubricoccus soli]MCP2685749.1 hypothetical protein [Siccirubricoccus soli]
MLNFWQLLEQQRKRPLAMVRSLGLVPVLRYVFGRPTLRGAINVLEQRCQARLSVVELPFGAAAVDVDKPADLLRAQQ